MSTTIVYTAADYGEFTFRVRELCPGMFDIQTLVSGKLVIDMSETSKLRAIGTCNGMRAALVNLNAMLINRLEHKPADTSDFGPQEEQHREHGAWRQICLQLEVLGVNINDQNALANAMRLWGEELHVLRLVAPEHDEKALADARTNCNHGTGWISE